MNEGKSHSIGRVRGAACAVFVLIVASLTACASQQQGPVDPLKQPLGASITPDGAPQPSAKAMERMMPYLDKVYSAAVPEIEMRPFRECYGRTVYAMMTPTDRDGFDKLVDTGRIMDNDVIPGMTRYFDRAIHDQTTRAEASRLCPKYADAYRSM